jgi:hypothetical protein
VAVREHGEEHRKPPDDATWALIGRLSAVAGEAIRAAARYHPGAREGESTLELVDWTLKVIDEGAGDPESPMQRGPMDADERGETRYPDRVSAMHLEPDQDPGDAFAESLFHVAEVCRAGIVWTLEGL